ncbi:hypothetical protein [Nocardia farcinica]|uniref:Uncharacterized protein n=1 Tax=Nocardia farcinica (strain IFM 10152) TaxID=247156 RepID=Q5YZG6_NOCFA|nr:hypothetical protein [Nocardia farcinica]BAD56425.1 hypothetical protein NFA_15790 [Nocardia farcinica IFM 10152]
MATNEEESKWLHHGLETPPLADDGTIDWDRVWLYRNKSGVQQPRPVFTGDVYRDVPAVDDDKPSTVMILQHPCALLDKNNELRDVLLTAKVVDYKEVSAREWAGNFDVMPLVLATAKHQAVAFDQLALVRSSELELTKRVACMEIEGVACLLQRWVNVNTRVIVPCWRFITVIEAQFAEADGMQAWCEERRHARVKPVPAVKEATNWLDEKSPDTGVPRRELLKEPAFRKHIVRQMQEVARGRSQREIAERDRVKAERAQAEAEAATAVNREVVDKQ